MTIETREKRMEQVLLLLDERGGLGHDMHDRIKESLGLPSGKFCRTPRDCLAAGRCMSCAKYDRACND